MVLQFRHVRSKKQLSTFVLFQAGLKIPRAIRLSRKYGFSKHEQDIFLLMLVMQVRRTVTQLGGTLHI